MLCEVGRISYFVISIPVSYSLLMMALIALLLSALPELEPKNKRRPEWRQW